MEDRSAFKLVPETGQFMPTRYAASPWIADNCHGGAVAALVAHVIQSESPLVPMDVARITLDLMRPVPRHSPLTVGSKILRDGKKMQLTEIAVSDREIQVARASVLRVPQPQRRLNREGVTSDSWTPPNEGVATYPLPTGFADLFTIVAVDGVAERGGSRRLWFRLNDAPVEGSPLTAFQQAVAAADFTGGMSSALDFSKWSYPSVDLTVSFHRQPTGAWTFVDARSEMSHDGIAICHASLYDEGGLFGYSLQTVLIFRR